MKTNEIQNIIDLRSDTVTQPTIRMRESMKNASVGDDVYGEDPTICELETRVATRFGKESALFFPSCTMSNLCALLTWCDRRGSEIILGNKSHIFLYEQSGASQFGGISYCTVPNHADGTMCLDTIRQHIREEDIHEPTTTCICVENTHNVCGGKILPLDFLVNLRKIADIHHLPIHMDGARIWNAMAEKTEIENNIMFQQVDSISLCLSKGLGAPVGSLLVGTKSFIQKARKIRKALGGGMRQCGVLAAAGLVALDDFETGILLKDHENARKIAEKLKHLEFMKIHYNIQTNIIFMDIPHGNANEIMCKLKQENICVSVWSPHLIRMVIHRNIDDQMVDRLIDELTLVDTQLCMV